MRVFPLLLCSVSVAIRLPACARTACTAAPCRHSLRSIRLSAGGGDDAGLFGALKKAAQDAVETGVKRLEKELSVAAMQEQIPEDEVRSGADGKKLLVPARPLPDSFEDSLRLAEQSCSEVIADGRTLIVIEFDTSAGDETYNLLSRSLTFIKPFLPRLAQVVAPTSHEVENTLANAEAESGQPPVPRIQLLFPDEGTAAYVQRNWEDLPPRTACMSLPRAQLVDGVEALLLIAPSATEVPAVQRLLQQVEERAPATVVLMVNPKLVDMQSTGYGAVGRDLRNMVTDSFTIAMALKTYPTGALQRLYPDGWSVWREEPSEEGGYELMYSSSRRPSGDEIAEIIAPPETDDGADGSGANALDGLSRFIKGFQAM